MAETTNTGLIPADRVAEIMALDKFSKECRTEIAKAREADNEMLTALVVARSMQGLREMITPAMLKDVMALANTQLGFKTDRDPKKKGKDGTFPTPYDEDTVRDCFITATLDGARVVGNEFNILSGGRYLTKEYYERQCREFPGVTSFDPRIGPPEYSQDHKQARCVCVARWKLNGVPQSLAYTVIRDAQGKVALDERISIRVNSGQSDDQTIGKAMRKLCLRVLGQLKGRAIEDDHDEPDGVEDAEVLRRETERSGQAAATQPPTAQASSADPSLARRAGGSEKTAGPAKETVAADPLAGVAERIAACTMIVDAQKVAEQVRKAKQLTPDQMLQLEVWVEQVSDQIRAKRGERTNGK